jgi:hypothetical protein
MRIKRQQRGIHDDPQTCARTQAQVRKTPHVCTADFGWVRCRDAFFRELGPCGGLGIGEKSNRLTNRLPESFRNRNTFEPGKIDRARNALPSHVDDARHGQSYEWGGTIAQGRANRPGGVRNWLAHVAQYRGDVGDECIGGLKGMIPRVH